MRRLWCGFCAAVTIATVVSAGSATANSTHVVAEPAPVASLEPAATAKLWGELVDDTVAPGSSPGGLPTASRASSTRRPTTSVSRPSSRRTCHPAPSTTSQFRHSSPTRPSRGETRRGAFAPSAPTSTPWPSSISPHGRGGSRAPARAGTSPARLRASAWPPPGTTFRRATRGSSTRSPPRSAETPARLARTCASFSAASSTATATRPTRGAVFVTGLGQQTSDLSLYQTNLQNWLSDSAFWTDMATYVSDWSQEVYGDVRELRRSRRVRGHAP